MRRVLLVVPAALMLAVLWGCGDETGGVAPTTVTVEVTTPIGSPTTEPAAVDAPGEADVVVEKSGAGQGEYDSASYGLVLRNRSADQDAVNVEVLVNLVAQDGTIAASETEYINVIPAKTRYYAGGSTSLESGTKLKNVDASVSIERSEDAELALPEVSNARLTRDEFGGATFRGQVRNPFTEPLSSFAKISIVAFDAEGRVVGGGFTFPDADIPPGGSAAWETFASGMNVDSLARIEASVDNEVAP